MTRENRHSLFVVPETLLRLRGSAGRGVRGRVCAKSVRADGAPMAVSNCAAPRRQKVRQRAASLAREADKRAAMISTE